MNTAPPLWLEGMLIKPQHFQQLTRHHTRQTQSQLESYYWGIETLNVNEAALREGLLIIERISGWFKDGSYFDTQDNATLPKPFSLQPSAKQTLYIHKSKALQAYRRLIKNDLDSADEHEISLGLIELQLSNESSDNSFKLMEIINDQGFFINTQYCPPCIRLHKAITSLALKPPPKPQETPNAIKQTQQQLALSFFYKDKEQLDLLLEHANSHPFEYYRLLRSSASSLAALANIPIQKNLYDHEEILESLKAYIQAINHSMHTLMRDEKSWLFQRQNAQYFDVTLSDYDKEAVFYLRINEETKHDPLKHAKLEEKSRLKECVHYGLPGIELISSTMLGKYQFYLDTEQATTTLTLYFPQKPPEDWSITVWQD
ncbi:MAG: hypothetical protein COV52_01065 [Gammaproteobacteria bacterium CG11_big_fil_rev_8_21_14_0_20_46_22]|nr:MAG: hypothetical protein COW05_03355 [Gammaproteobacteria bacterium CG12_big_fil_rev_8_21_14_0_65_46_12]PIR12008.1 MAG: hypothetical protein COV52_01065 [Gammaproteobacteria bacterium CG11_big_fil_rev_8_21_14_0_20_46_22]